MQTVFLLLPIKLRIQLKLSGERASAFHVRKQHYESLMLNIKGTQEYKNGCQEGYFLFTECNGLKHFQCNLEGKWHQASKTEGNLIHLLKIREPTMWHETSLRFSHLCIMLRKVMWSSSSVLSFAVQKAHLLTAPEEKASFITFRT